MYKMFGRWGYQWSQYSAQWFNKIFVEYEFRIPLRIPEFLAAALILSSSVLTYFFGLFFVLPEILGDSYPSCFLLLGVTGTWILVAIYSNFFLVRKRNSSIQHRMLMQPVVAPLSPTTNETHPYDELNATARHMGEYFTQTPYGDNHNWHICAVCEIFVPPRTWHCNHCNICILRRDHHCIFTGCCIGEENQCNFLGLVFYLSAGCTISAAFSLYYFLYLKEISIWMFIFRSFVLMYTLIFNFDIIQVLSSLTIVGAFVSTGVLVYYLHLAMKGQTSADSFRKIDRSISGSKQYMFENFTNFLGPNPILRILWPFHQPLKTNYGGTPQQFKSE